SNERAGFSESSTSTVQLNTDERKFFLIKKENQNVFGIDSIIFHSCSFLLYLVPCLREITSFI
ncbi:hypothetical protein ACJX0J_023091, partial [Zea mays]